MAGFVTYWPQEQVRKLQKAGDQGPIRVVLGSVHTKMPSIRAVKPGDTIYPLAQVDGALCVMARLPVDKVECAFDYLMRETGRHYAALVPQGIALQDHTINGIKVYSTADGIFHKEELPEGMQVLELGEALPHQCHQEPFNCCSQHAASGSRGSGIRPRPIPEDMLPQLRFGSVKSKQKPLKQNAKGRYVADGFTRKMSDASWKLLDSLFDGED